MRVVSALVAASPSVSAAGAETLVPGRPAGVRAAQSAGPSLYLVATVGTLAVAGVAVLISGSSSALATTVIPGGEVGILPTNSVTTTTTSTATTG
jgi:hypothetical protein